MRQYTVFERNGGFRHSMLWNDCSQYIPIGGITLDYRKSEQMGCKMGKLPSKAPLANPYVPFQMENPARYEARRGLIRGTLYPGLDLPFRGMVNTREKSNTPMHELQALAFALQELALYLDTHPHDSEALELYRKYQKQYHDLMMKHAEQCRPLTHANPVSHKNYTWLCDPWPWEYAANKEG